MPAGFEVMASLAVETAECAPPIAVARGRSTKAGHGAPGSLTLLSARAAAVTASRAAMNVRIRGAVYCPPSWGARKRPARVPPLSGPCANKGPAIEEEHGAVSGGRCYLSRPRGGAMNHPLRKVVVPAAGLGTRFLPATKAIPKEMLPIVDTPTIQLIVEEALSAGAQEGGLVNGRGEGAIEDHFHPADDPEDPPPPHGEKGPVRQGRRAGQPGR